MKKQILAYVLSAAFFTVGPAFAMDTVTEVDGESFHIKVPSGKLSEKEAQEVLKALNSLQQALQRGKRGKLLEQMEPCRGVGVDYTHRAN